MAIQADGKIVAAGKTYDSIDYNDDFALARYNTDGTLDTSFGTGGKVITAIDPYFDDEALAVAMKKLLKDKSLRNRNIEAGRIRASRFTWEKTCEATCRVYDRVLETCRNGGKSL